MATVHADSDYGVLAFVAAAGIGDSESITCPRSVYEAGASTLNGFAMYAMRPSGATTNSDRLSTLFLGIVGAVFLPDCAASVAGEYDREVGFSCPVRVRGVRIDADTDHGDLAAVVKERGVLITVRLHLDRSAFGPRLVEEGEDDGLAPVVAEPTGALTIRIGCHRPT